MSECAHCGSDIQDKSIDDIVFEYIDLVVKRVFLDHIKNSEFLKVFNDHVKISAYSIADQVVRDCVNENKIIDRAGQAIQWRVGASLQALKELKDDIMSGKIQEFFYRDFAKPEVRFDEILKQLFEMKSEIESLKQSFITVQKRIKDD